MRLCIETRTLRRDWAAVHPGPGHVLEWNTDHTYISLFYIYVLLHSPKNAKTDFAVLVKVWIESDYSTPCGQKFHSRGSKRVIRREPDKKVKETPFIWSIKRTCDQRMNLKTHYKNFKAFEESRCSGLTTVISSSLGMTHIP